MNTSQCKDIGFSNNLLCSSCDELKQFKLNKLESSCNDCCLADQEKQEAEVNIISLMRERELNFCLFLNRNTQELSWRFVLENWVDTRKLRLSLKAIALLNTQI